MAHFYKMMLTIAIHQVAGGKFHRSLGTAMIEK